MAKKREVPLLDLFRCDKCKSFKSTLSNYGYCKILKNYVYEENTFCEANGLIDPELWFMKDPHLTNYLRMEKQFKIRILPGHMDRSKYKII
ncbi:MAG: hypothetical protein WBA74_10345 [Cyclobacteriaceae bacterium]